MKQTIKDPKLSTPLADLVIAYHDARQIYESEKYKAINRLSAGMNIASMDAKDIADLQRTMEIAEYYMMNVAKQQSKTGNTI